MAGGIFKFGGAGTEGSAGMKNLLGGKGANLAEMAKIGLPVPPGFTITTDVCNGYLSASNKAAFIKALMPEVMGQVTALTEQFGYTPLLSVRSGARVSMPGMMDTLLNIGLTSMSLPEWSDRLGERATLDSYRRMMQMYGAVVLGVKDEAFENILTASKQSAGVVADHELEAAALKSLIKGYFNVIGMAGKTLPDTLEGQLQGAIEAVFNSWNTPRAKAYRAMNGYPEGWGTAVNIQAMVFGNMNAKSGTGVLFTRNPSTGAAKVTGEFLQNAQGEDVVAGIRTPEPLEAMLGLSNEWATIHNELIAYSTKLEQHYADMQDIEFTIQDGQLFILQCRNGKRSAKAAFKIAADMVDEGLLSAADVKTRVTAAQYLALRTPSIDAAKADPPMVAGLAAGGGVVTGKIALSEAAAKQFSYEGSPIILVTHETTPDDIVAMNMSAGILTQTGGLTSHAAVVARGMDKTCVVGCTGLTISGNEVHAGVHKLGNEGDLITIDGATGNVWAGAQPIVAGEIEAHVMKILKPLLGDMMILKGDGTELAMATEDYCLTTEWFSPTYSLQAAVDKFVEVRAKVTGRLVVDLTSDMDTLSDDAALIYTMMGMDPKQDAAKLFQSKLAALVASGIKCVVLTGEYKVAKADLSEGQSLVCEAETIEDVMAGAIVTEDFVKKVVGSAEAMEKLVQAMASIGVKVGGQKPEPMTEVEAVFNALGQ